MANSRKHLIYLVYGRQTYHQEALFSIASAFAHLRDGAAHGLTVRVYTDDPSPYAGLPVQVREVTAEELVAWCQPHGYHFRAKHVALRDALEDADQALLIDTDTFFHSSPLRLFDRIQPGSLLCNAIGARYGEHRNFPLYRDLSPYLFERGWADDEMHQLNSGVIGLPREEAKILDRSLELMDELYPIANGAYTLEEFVLAVAAHRVPSVCCTSWEPCRCRLRCASSVSNCSTVATNTVTSSTGPAAPSGGRKPRPMPSNAIRRNRLRNKSRIG